MEDFIFIDNAYININDIIAIENDITSVNIYCTNNILQLNCINFKSDILIDNNFLLIRYDFFINPKFISSINISKIDEHTKQVDINYILDYNAPKHIRTSTLSI